jgi:RNA polymerase sigma-70 factor (ECF subfamily)
MDERRKAILDELPKLRRYARSLLRNADSADDLVQDCLERALMRLDNWRTGDSPRRWLFTIMYNLFIDRMRRDRRTREDTMIPLEAAEAMAVPAHQEMDAGSREILDALQALSPERRTALLIVAVEGFSYAEASEILGIPAGTLMSRVARGRDDLRAILDGTARRRAIRVVE